MLDLQRRIGTCGDCTAPHNVTASVLEPLPNGRGSIERLTDMPVETLHHAVGLGHGAVIWCLMSSSAHRWSNLLMVARLCSRAVNNPSAYSLQLAVNSLVILIGHALCKVFRKTQAFAAVFRHELLQTSSVWRGRCSEHEKIKAHQFIYHLWRVLCIEKLTSPLGGRFGFVDAWPPSMSVQTTSMLECETS